MEYAGYKKPNLYWSSFIICIFFFGMMNAVLLPKPAPPVACRLCGDQFIKIMPAAITGNILLKLPGVSSVYLFIAHTAIKVAAVR